MEIVPAILTNSREDLARRLECLSGKVERVQIDVVDGRFAEQKTFLLFWLDEHQDKGFHWDIHLMVANPFGWVERCNSVMAEQVIGQIESMGDQLDFIDRVEGEGMRAGLAVDLPTSIKELNDEAVFRASIILVMSVKAGFSGQKFEAKALEKIEKLVKVRRKLGASFKIGVDGGINQENQEKITAAGGEILYMGHSYWEKHLP